MTVHLQRLRFIATTSKARDAGTDHGVDFWFYVVPGSYTTYPDNGWQTQNLDHPWDDRERGRTDMYEIDLTIGDLGIAISGTPVPRGLGYADWAEARSASFYLRMRGDDWWRIDNYHMVGYYKELQHVAGTIDAFRTIDHGWLLAASRDGDVDMSTDPTEGSRWHYIALNGPLV